MYCIKCGHPLDDGMEFCPNCGAQIHKVSVETEGEEPAPHVKSTEYTESGKNLKPFIMIVAGLILLVALVMLLINFGALKNWFVGLFTTPEELLVNVYKATANAVLEPVLQEYDENLSQGNQESVSSRAQILVKPGQQILDTLAYAVYGGEGDMSWLSEIRLDVDFAIKNKLQKNVLGLGLGEHDILSLELTTDSENKKQYLAIPELSDQAVLMDMSQTPELQSADMTKLYDALPSGQTIKQIFDRYLDILLHGCSNVEKHTQEVTLGEITQKLTVLEAMTDEVDLIEVTAKLLEQAKQDQDIKEVLEALDPWYQDMLKQSMDSYYDSANANSSQTLYEEFIAEVDATLADLQEQLKNADPDNQMTVYTYLDDRYHIVGIKLQATDMEETVSGMALCQDGRISVQIIMGDTQLTGNGQIDESVSGSYELFAGKDKMLDIKLENVTDSAGNVYLEPSAILMTELAEQMGVDNSGSGMMGMADVVLRVCYEEAEKSSKSSVTVLSNDISVLELIVSGEITQQQEITVPVNAVDLNAEEAAYNWLAGLNVEGVIQKITDAGVPVELFASLLVPQ